MVKMRVEELEEYIKEMWRKIRNNWCIVCNKPIEGWDVRCDECRYETEVKDGIQR